MIIKSQARKSIKSIKQLLEYVTRADALFKDDAGNTLLIKHNLRGKNINANCAEYIKNEANRARKMKNTNAIYHEILAWHELDRTKLTLEKLEQMTRNYIHLRNQNALVLATAHMDKGHIHIHLVISGVQKGTGESLRVSRDAFKEMKMEMEKYQEKCFPELVHSMVDHNQSKKKTKRQGISDESKGKNHRERSGCGYY